MNTLNRRSFLKRLGMGTAALTSSGCTGMFGRQKKTRRPNFIIILADDMGYGDASCYGGWIHTPHLDQLAAGGIRFTDFHSSGVVCSPTRAGLLTGQYQQRVGVPRVINADPKVPSHQTGLDPREITFPGLLKDAGYSTAIFGKWHLGYTKNFNPVHFGFDLFRGYVSGNIDYISHYDRMGVYDWWDGLEKVEEEGYVTHLITRHAKDFIEQHREAPFCLYVSHEAVHTPIQGPDDLPLRGPGASTAKKNEEEKKDTYRRMMDEMDKSVGEIVAMVKEAGIDRNTLIIFLSDNGGTKQGSNGSLRGFKDSVWEGGHRVPAIFRWPGKIEAGNVSDQLCISIDLKPTMLELAGVEGPQGHEVDGISLVPLLLKGRSLGERQLFWNGKAMRDGAWKLVVQKEKTLLYDISNDLGEERDLSDAEPERVEAMVKALDAWKRDVGIEIEE